MEDIAPIKLKLSSLVIGSRLVVRSKLDWRFASIACINDERVTITVCSPRGRTYRLRRTVDAEVECQNGVPVLTQDAADHWRENLTRYDLRW